ncbi:MAG: hypothetical protein GXO90_00545, partial [FCB group bacterium]|nr:hypothetical protein [FCB group bacterium]
MCAIDKLKLTVLLFLSLVTGADLPALQQWYSVSSLALAGGGLFYSGEADRFNPAATADRGRGFESSVLNYPAGIQAYRAAWYPGNTGPLTSVTIRYMDYGDFTGLDDEGNPTNDFSAADTWIQAAAARQSASGHSAWGLSTGFLSNTIGDLSYRAFILTGSAMIRLDSSRIKIGVAVQNFGWVQSSSSWRQLPGQVEITLSRALAHLPLDLYLDGRWVAGRSTYGLGGVFQINPMLQFMIGTSSNRLLQMPGDGSVADIIADTG